MPNLFPILIGGGVVALAFLTWSKFQSLNDFYQNLIITPKIDGGLKNFKLTLSTLSVPIAIDFGNRSDQNVTLQLQAFDLLFKGKIVAQSKPNATEVRRPLRCLYDKKGDCDCYATLIGSILENLNIPYKFRIAAYNGNSHFQHVYVIVPNGSGYYTCDPVVDKFNYEKPTSKVKDF